MDREKIKEIRPIIWDDDNNQLILIDQRKLPNKLEYFSCNTYEDVAFAIRDMVVRGAPAIGISAAYGMALAEIKNEDIERAYNTLKNTRPTAINLFWALNRCKDAHNNNKPIIDEAKLIHR